MSDSSDTTAADAADVTTSAATAVAPSKPASKSKLRTVISVLVGIVAVLGVFLSATALWARSTLLDGDKVANAAVDALNDPEVADAAAARITDLIFQSVPIDQTVADILPEQLDKLEPAIVGGIKSTVDGLVQRVLQQPQVQEVFRQVIIRAHDDLVKVLRGEKLQNRVNVSNGEVSINLLPLLSKAVEEVQSLGLFSSKDFPTFEPGGDPQQQIQELQAAFPNRNIPDDFGQVVVYRSDSLAQAEQTIARAQDTVKIARQALVGIILLTIVLLVASVLIANRRRRAVVGLAIGIVFVMILTRVFLNRVVEKAPKLVVQPGGQQLIRDLATTFSQSFYRLTALVILVSLLAALFAFLTGPSDTAAKLRNAAGGGSKDAAGIVARHPEGSAIGLFALAVLVLWIAGLSWFTFLVAGALAIVGAVILLYAARAGSDDETPAEPTAV